MPRLLSLSIARRPVAAMKAACRAACRATCWAAAVVAALAGPAAAAETADNSFETTVATLLAKRCGACHGPASAESGFRIDERSRAITGGDSGIAGIVAGKPQESEIFRRITTDDAEARMPADAEPLPAAERAIIE